MFQVKDFSSVAASMIAHMRATQSEVTDFTVGSVARTLVEAPAIEIDEFYQRLLFGLLESIPVAVFDAFGFAALPALPASGQVRYTLSVLRSTPLAIPAGSIVKVSTDRRRYLVTQDAEIPAGQLSVLVSVRAEVPGVDWNASVGEIDQSLSSLAEQVAVTNPLPLSNGRDEESVEDRKRRFISFVGSLSRGTVYANDYAARSTMLVDGSGVPIEYVTHVGIDEVPGYAAIYIYSSAGVPSAALLAKIDDVINGHRENGVVVPGYRPVGVQVEVLPMSERKIDVELNAWAFSGVTPPQSVINAIRDAISRAIAAVEPGDVLYVDQVSAAALSVREVERVNIGMTENIRAGINQVLSLDNLIVSWEI